MRQSLPTRFNRVVPFARDLFLGVFGVLAVKSLRVSARTFCRPIPGPKSGIVPGLNLVGVDHAAGAELLQHLRQTAIC
jgi:hypothetical protein